jgi:DNA-binding response OmpR family regulator
MSNESPITPIILVVDDDPQALQLVGKLLSDELACDICLATSGGEALEIMESVTPDLVLLDVKMPDMDGYEVCKSIRAKEEYREIPVIFLTIHRDPEHIVMGFEAGGTDYVAKPFESRELLARARVQLELKLSRDELKRQKEELEATISRIRHLEGIIPICMYCKKIREDHDGWKQLEEYISEHSDAQFTHSICPACAAKALAELKKQKR